MIIMTIFKLIFNYCRLNDLNCLCVCVCVFMNASSPEKIGNFMLLNLFLAVLLDNFEAERLTGSNDRSSVKYCTHSHKTYQRFDHITSF